ncbi:NarL family two-component system response regulator LiaR [Mucilaginibacter sp. UYNi724]
MATSFWIKNRSVLLYSASLAALLFLMKWLEWRFIIVDYSFELYAGATAFIFTMLGVWLALKIAKPKTLVVEKHVLVKTNDFVFDADALTRLSLSKREMEVLQLMADGLSNQGIAEKLFVSLNTIKTHTSKVFEKLEVQRRTQAVDKAKKLNIIP